MRRLASPALSLLTILLIVGSARAAEVPFSTLARGMSSGYQQEATLIIRDNDTWNALWANLTATGSPPSEPSGPDFSTQMVVAAMMGPQPTCRNTIEISGISIQDDVLRVNVSKIFGKDYESPCPTDISPYHIVQLQRFDGPSSIETDSRNIPTGSLAPITPLAFSLILGPVVVATVYLILRHRNRAPKIQQLTLKTSKL